MIFPLPLNAALTSHLFSMVTVGPLVTEVNPSAPGPLRRKLKSKVELGPRVDPQLPF